MQITSQEINFKMAMIIVFNVCNLLTLPHPGGQHAPHARHGALAELVALPPVIIKSLVSLTWGHFTLATSFK